jgi:uncharacterized protein (TIGR03067 family)
MTYRLTTILVVGALSAAVGSLAAAGDAKEEAIKKDRKAYEGTWRVVSVEADGNSLSEDDAKKYSVINTADGKWTLEADGTTIGQGTSIIDPTKTPKTIDFTPTEGPNKDKTSLGIYELSGDTRKLCYAPPGKDRPTEFSARAGTGFVLVQFKREKK